MSAVEVSWRFGRYVCQLHRLHIYFCRYSGSSRGMRDFLENKVTYFAENNPSISIYVNEMKRKHPKLEAHYLNGNTKEVIVQNMEETDIFDALEQLRNQSGKEWLTDKIRKTWHTDKPSIQGTWNPLLNKPAPDFSK
ncbi:large ribosomal subunit protein mL43-like [Rhopilema esculentum]|uniref:large ribosomal subunit protein mL43-like n=1 Tax=Rhopilema esculentum TaxID=499914 RepID=UPI0031E11E93|eukprot:gene12351-3004_t